MGIVFKHEDILRGRKRLLEAGLRDLSPQLKENIFRTLESWEGSTSEDRLKTLVGEERAKRIKELLKQ